MKTFYCNGKKGFCDCTIVCKDCEFFDNKGGEYKDKPQTEYDRIRTMDKKELGKFLCSLMNADDCYTRCPAQEYCSHGHNGMEEYLSRPVKEEDDHVV